MGMELKQSLKMSQSLVMTPQLQQAIKLLQLSRMELIEQIREEMEQNPLLEQTEDTAEMNMADKEPGQASLEADNLEPNNYELKGPEKAEEFKPEEKQSKDEDWESLFLNSSQFNEPTTASNKGSVDFSDLPSFEANMVKKEDLVAHLTEQLTGLDLNDAEARVAMLIIGNLTDDGYLKLEDVEGDPLIRLASEADVPVWVAEKTLKKILHLEPRGCGARDLQECLQVQLSAFNDRSAALLGTILKKHLKYLESKNYPAIARELKVTVDEVLAAARLLNRLDPRPGRNFTGADAQYIEPDVFIMKTADEYMVVLNDDGLSKLRISDSYRSALKQGQLPPGQTKEFVQDKMRSATWLLRSIYQRQKTILKVTESIVKKQRDFFDKGVAHLRPMILRDVAEDIGMHESTVSRVTTNKYVHTPQGIFELKYFFNSPIARTSGEDVASEAVRNHIKLIVGAENPKSPYSDQKIVEILKSQGIEIARRTVAKYREVLGVLPSSKRKRYI
jgi:RNA polymerase sigma-54 factor